MPGVDNKPATAHEALIDVCTQIENSGVEGKPEDFAYIKAILQDVVVDAMFQAHESLGKPVDPVDHNATGTVNQFLDEIAPDQSRDGDAAELFEILADSDLQAVLQAHDDIAKKMFEPEYPLQPEPMVSNEPELTDDRPIRIVTVRRSPGEPLGITVHNPENSTDLTVLRIAPGSTIDRQELLHPGDVILEVNGVPVNTPEDLGSVIKRSGATEVQFRVLAATRVELDSEIVRQVEPAVTQRFLRAHFWYNPREDSRLKNPSKGLTFHPDDILQILDDKDPDWWECKNLNGNTGVIPSPSFEEKRSQQITEPANDKTKSSFLCGLGGKKKKKSSSNNAPIAPTDRPNVLYEEVIRAEPFQHKCLVLVGAQGVGRRSIKMNLIQTAPSEFGMATASTSRPMREGEIDGQNYHFRTRSEMEADIKTSRYLEHGELNGNYYGTALSALESVIDSNRTCIVDPKSTVLTKLRTARWLPYVVFIKPTGPESLRHMNMEAINSGIETPKKTDEEMRRIMEETKRINRQFIHLCDTVIDYDNFENSCRKVRTLFERANTTSQWVPKSWSSAVRVAQ